MTARTSHDTAREIPEATVARLPVYLRALTTLAEAGTATCSSEELAAAAGVNCAKLRKDLSYLGSYGTRGVGYDVDYLRYQIARELGLTQDWPVVIVGIGNLGPRAGQLLRLRAAAASASSRSSTPTRERHERGRRRRRRPPVRRPRARSSREHGVAIGVIATPAAAAQDVCDQLVAAGVTQHPQLRADRADRRPTASTCARSTSPSSCRSSPSTSSARPPATATRREACA